VQLEELDRLESGFHVHETRSYQHDHSINELMIYEMENKNAYTLSIG